MKIIRGMAIMYRAHARNDGTGEPVGSRMKMPALNKCASSSVAVSWFPNTVKYTSYRQYKTAEKSLSVCKAQIVAAVLFFPT